MFVAMLSIESSIFVAALAGSGALALAGGARWFREVTAPEGRSALRNRAARRIELIRLSLLAGCVALLLIVMIESPARWMEWAALAFLATLVWAARRPTEDAFAALVIAFGRMLASGDWVEVNGRRGRVLRRGMFWVRMSGTDGKEWIVPNREILAGGLATIARAAADTPVDVLLPVPAGASLRASRERAAICAATSPYASMRRRPETFLDIEGGHLRHATVRVRGYVYDPAYVEMYRSHVVEAWLEGSLETPAAGGSHGRAVELGRADSEA